MSDLKIKRPKSSYIFFTLGKERNKIIDDFKLKNMKFSTKEVLIELGVRWKSMSETDKEPYKKLAAADKERYENQIADVDNKYITGYQLYCNDNIERVKNDNQDLSGELGYKYVQILANEWKTLDKKTIEEYNKRSDDIFQKLILKIKKKNP